MLNKRTIFKLASVYDLMIKVFIILHINNRILQLKLYRHSSSLQTRILDIILCENNSLTRFV